MGEGVCPSRRRPPRRNARDRTAAAVRLRRMADPAIPMRRSVTYTVVITRHPRYYVARCPALPSCVTLHKSRARAYAEVKRLIREQVTSFVADDHPLPPDPVVSVKHLRLNLTEIREEVDLR